MDSMGGANAPESTGHALVIPSCYVNRCDRGHISNRLSRRRGGNAGTPMGTLDNKAKIKGFHVTGNPLLFIANYGAPGEIQTPDRLVRSPFRRGMIVY
jgi:hypothetical protein